MSPGIIAEDSDDQKHNFVPPLWVSQVMMQHEDGRWTIHEKYTCGFCGALVDSLIVDTGTALLSLVWKWGRVMELTCPRCHKHWLIQPGK